MEWLEAYARDRARGAHAFLFVGSIGDGFPPGNGGASETADQLIDWEEAMVRSASAGSAITVVFDAARGFSFPIRNDEKRFRALLRHGESRPRDAVEAARAQAEEAAPLPADASSAFVLIRAALDRAAESGGDGPTPLTVLFPDADVIIGNGGPSGGNRAVALGIAQCASSDAYRRAGHQFLLSAPAAHALDERLRRPETPVVLIAVRKPDEASRLAFGSRICVSADLISGQIAACAAALEAARAAERERLQIKMTEAEQVIGIRERWLAVQIQGDERLRALRERLSGISAVVERLRKDQVTGEEERRATLMRDLETCERILQTSPDVAVNLLSDELWRSIEPGSRIRFVSEAGTVEKAVLQVIDAATREAVLSLTDDPGEAQRGLDGCPIRFFWRDGQMWGRAESDPRGDHAASYAVIGDYQALLVPKDRLLLVGAREDTLRELARIEQRLPSAQLSAAEREKDELAADLAAWERQIREGAERELGELRGHLESYRGALASPQTDEILRGEEKLADLQQQADAEARAGRYAQPTMGLPEFARLARGFGFRDIVAVLRASAAERRPLEHVTLLERRRDILARAYGDLLEIIDPAYDFSGVAGLDGIKQFFLGIRDAIRSGNLRNVPMGAMLMGPPGTGKSAVAEAFAAECGFLFLKVRNTRAMWVGESERQQEAVLQAISDLAPTVVFRDEVDEEDTGRDAFQGDSGVSARLRQMWMQFLSDPKIRGRVFVVSATNRPDRLDAALKRSGRTDERIPVLMPDRETRIKLFEVMIRRAKFESDITDFGPHADLTAGLSGADIEVIVRRADGRSCGRGITDEDIRWAVADMIPSASAKDIARMTLIAIRETSSKSYLPPNVAEIAAEAERVLAAT